MKLIKIKIPTDAEVMDYAAENYTPPETAIGLETLLRHVRRQMLIDRQNAALAKHGIKFSYICPTN